jgi:hypothetical protein
MHRPAADLIVIDTLGKLYAHGYGLTGYCRVCRRYLKVPMLALIAARGADSPVAGIVPLTCAGCGGRETVSLAHIAREKVRLLPRDAICSDVGADPRSPARGATSAADALAGRLGRAEIRRSPRKSFRLPLASQLLRLRRWRQL